MITAAVPSVLRVLVVDDERDVLEAYQASLDPPDPVGADDTRLDDLEARLFGEPAAVEEERPAREVVPCRQAEEAVEAVRAAVEEDRPFALVFLDVRMPPGKSGVWAAERIRAIDPNVEIVIVTGYSDLDPATIASRVPPAERFLYLQKPFFPFELQQLTASLGAKWFARRLLERAHQSLAERHADLARMNESLQAELRERRRIDADRARLAMAVEHVTDSIVICDIDHRIVYVNPAFERISGYSRDEVIGRGPTVVLAGDCAPALQQEIQHALVTAGSWSGRLRNRRKDGALYDVEAGMASVRNADGDIVNYVSVHRDVTREQTLQQQLWQSQKMEAVGRLAGGIAHDFNNMLAVITGYSALLLSGQMDPDAMRGGLTQIKHASDRAALLTRQLLAFTSRQVLNKRSVDLHETVMDTKSMLDVLLGDDVELVVESEQGLEAVAGDPGQIAQVLMNLVVNARDAMSDRGRVTVSTRNVEVESAGDDMLPEPGRYVVLEVSDTGCGMDARTLARAFEPFFTTKEPGKGTGLGMSTVFGIVKQSGGEVRVESTPGRGTTVRVYLPSVAAAAGEKTAEIERHLPQNGAGTVLLVEDEASVREFAAILLETEGYDVIQARDGQEALEVAAAHAGRIDIAVSDLLMPRMGGLEFGARFVEQYPGAKVLYMSGFADAEAIERGVLEDGSPFILKPFHPADFAALLKSVLDGDAVDD